MSLLVVESHKVLVSSYKNYDPLVTENNSTEVGDVKWILSTVSGLEGVHNLNTDAKRSTMVINVASDDVDGYLKDKMHRDYIILVGDISPELRGNVMKRVFEKEATVVEVK